MWRAIRQHPDTKNVFNRSFDFESESAAIVTIAPSPSDFPCIAIFPTQVDPAWWVHSMQEWAYALRVQVWVKDWVLTPAEKLARQIVEAVFQGGRASSTTAGYVETVINGKLPIVQSATLEQVEIAQPDDDEPVKAIRVDIVFVLKIQFDPLGR